MTGEPPQIIIWRERGTDGFLVERTRRSLREAGLTGVGDGALEVTVRVEVIESGDDGLGLANAVERMSRSGRPVLLVQAGAWFARMEKITLPPLSATGLGVCALGVEPVRQVREGGKDWFSRLASGSGNLRNIGETLPQLGMPPAVFLDARAVGTVLESSTTTRESGFWNLLFGATGRLRVVHWPELDAVFDRGLRVLQVITSLQRGGAERLTLSLVSGLAARLVSVRVAALGSPTRSAFPKPREWIDLDRLRRAGETNLDPLLRCCAGFDVLHLHLIKAADSLRLAEKGVPIVVTVHNSRPGWPEDLLEKRGGGASLVAACSLGVERELRAAGMPGPIRTVWNGIDFERFTRGVPGAAKKRDWRQQWGFADEDLVLVAVANFRPQKRLHLLPAILKEVQGKLAARHDSRRARLVVMGEVSAGSSKSVESGRELRREIARLGLKADVRLIGATEDVAGALRACDVVLSASAYEGLSLANLEAAAIALPIVCTDVAGHEELGRKYAGLRRLPVDATPTAFAAEVIGAADVEPCAEDAAALRASFSSGRMAERYLGCYRRLTATRSAPRRGLWLVTNNFSMGGAQSSARRLLGALAEQGIAVRAAVVQEEPQSPTEGRKALIVRGIPVHAAGPLGQRNPEAVVDELLEALDRDPPEAVLFWNLAPACKVLLADALLDAKIFDVSPGEMFFQSWDKYFANPLPGLPYLKPDHYGRRLSGIVVKYRAERTAAEAFGVPVEVIPNGVPISPPHPDLSGKKRILTFGTAARINPQKRLEDLLEAVRLAAPRMPPFELLIAGRVEPGCRDYFASLCRMSGELPVRWLGELPGTAGFLAGLDAFVMISEPAGCPNASLEALAAGLPVIATDVGGASEQVIDGVTGLLTPPRNPEALATALVTLAMDAELRARLGRQARQHVEHAFTIAAMVKNYRRILEL